MDINGARLSPGIRFSPRKAEVKGNVLRYTRTSEVKDPSVPLNKVDDLKMLYRIIASDERNTAVLKPAGTP
jgi:metal-sulfur cluster biosynthetic enzyme